MSTDRLTALTGRVGPTDAGAAEHARLRHERLAKPPGSLGRLEDVGGQLAAIAGRCPPPVPAQPAALVCVADHGVHARGVTPWPQSVTAVMAEQLAAGTASAGAIARTVGARVRVVDVGLAGAVPQHPNLVRARVRDGTRDWTAASAMSPQEAVAALLTGADAADALLDDGVDLLVPGEMGLANTTTAAALVAAMTGAAPEAVVGPGSGADEGTVARKAEVVRIGLDGHRPDPSDPVAVLAAVGGLEHAAMAGAILAAAARRTPVLLDGVSSLAAALLAERLAEPVHGYLLAGHRSAEPGAAVALDTLGLTPLLELSLRLGEGTGGLLAVPLVVAAARVLADVVPLADLGLG